MEGKRARYPRRKEEEAVGGERKHRLRLPS